MKSLELTAHRRGLEPWVVLGVAALFIALDGLWALL